LLHRYLVPPVTDATVGTPIAPGWSVVTPTNDADTVSVTVTFVRVAVPAFVTTIRYVNASPTPGLAGVWLFTTDTFITAGCTTLPTPFVNICVEVQTLFATTYAVSDTQVGTHTTPTLPVIVNVYDVAGYIVNPLRLHTYSVPVPATLVTTGAAHPAGWSPALPTTTGEIVSVTSMFSIVAPPVFVTTMRYVSNSPIPGVAGACCFTTEMFRIGAGRVNDVRFVYMYVAVHALDPNTYAVLLATVCTHTGPTTPVIVNV